MKVELGSRYAKCCKDSKNWVYDGETVCSKCGRVLDEIIDLVAFS